MDARGGQVGGRRRGLAGWLAGWGAGRMGYGGAVPCASCARLQESMQTRSHPPSDRERVNKPSRRALLAAPPAVPAPCRRDAMEYMLLMPSSPAGLTMRGVPYSVSI